MKKETHSRHKAPPHQRFGLALRWVGLVGALVVVNIWAGMQLKAYTASLANGGALMLNLTLLALLLAYALLLAIPFVPGVEIGISLLVSFGGAAAPYVYLATIGGLGLAFLFGTVLSDRISCKFLMVLGLTRACHFVDEIKQLSRGERLARMERAMPTWARRWLLQRRYLVLALLLNLPGNALIGGGGGIAMLAGLSRTFSIGWFILTITLATLPVPLAVYIFGSGLLA